MTDSGGLSNSLSAHASVICGVYSLNCDEIAIPSTQTIPHYKA